MTNIINHDCIIINPTNRPTPTPTVSFSATHTRTPTQTSSATPPSTLTPTQTPTQTKTSTRTPLPTPSTTSTTTASPTPTTTTTATVTPSNTATVTPTSSIDNSPTPTPTSSIQFTPTKTSRPTPTPTPTNCIQHPIQFSLTNCQRIDNILTVTNNSGVPMRFYAEGDCGDEIIFNGVIYEEKQHIYPWPIDACNLGLPLNGNHHFVYTKILQPGESITIGGRDNGFGGGTSGYYKLCSI